MSDWAKRYMTSSSIAFYLMNFVYMFLIVATTLYCYMKLAFDHPQKSESIDTKEQHDYNNT